MASQLQLSDMRIGYFEPGGRHPKRCVFSDKNDIADMYAAYLHRQLTDIELWGSCTAQGTDHDRGKASRREPASLSDYGALDWAEGDDDLHLAVACPPPEKRRRASNLNEYRRKVEEDVDHLVAQLMTRRKGGYPEHVYLLWAHRLCARTWFSMEQPPENVVSGSVPGSRRRMSNSEMLIELIADKMVSPLRLLVETPQASSPSTSTPKEAGSPQAQASVSVQPAKSPTRVEIPAAQHPPASRRTPRQS